jgi:hypothetical protein
MRRQFSTRGLVASLENEEPIVAVVAPEPEVVVVVPVEDNGNSLETTLVEVAEDAADSELIEAQTDQAMAVAETLADVETALESCLAEGGLNKSAAHVVGMCLESLYASVGMSGVRAMPSLESFGGTGSRVQATKLALESVAEKAKEIWAKIVQAVEKSIAWLVEKYKQFFTAAGRLKSRGEALAKRATDTKDAEPKSKTIEDERLAQQLHISGNLDKAVASVGEIKGMLPTWLSTDAAHAEAIAEGLEKSDSSVIVTTFAKIPQGLTVADAAAIGAEKPADSLGLYRSKELPGGRAILARLPMAGSGDKASLADGATKASMVIGPFNATFTNKNKTLPTLSTADAGKIASDVAEIAKAVESFKSGLDKVTAAKKRIVAACKKLGSAVAEEKDEAKKKELETLKKFGAAVPRLIDSPPASINVFVLNVGKAFLDYVEASLKQYAAPEAKKEEPKAAEAAPAAAAAAA